MDSRKPRIPKMTPSTHDDLLKGIFSTLPMMNSTPKYFTLLTPSRIQYPMFHEPKDFRNHLDSQGFTLSHKTKELDGMHETYERGNLIIRFQENKYFDIGIKGVKIPSFSMFTTISQYLPSDKLLDEVFFRFWETSKTFHSSYFNCIKDLFPHDNFMYFAFDYVQRSPQYRFEDGSEKMKCTILLSKDENMNVKMELTFRKFEVESINLSIDVFPASFYKTMLTMDFVPSKDDPKDELSRMFRDLNLEMKTSLTKADFNQHG